MDVALVIPNHNGARWLPGLLESVAAQTVTPAEVLVVDDGSTDGSAELVAGYDWVRVLALEGNGGFARTANAGIAAVSAEAVALVNTDVVLAPDWLERAVAALEGDRGAAAVATKLVDLEDPAILYSAGDVLRRDGACEQRGRFERDSGRYDMPGEVFSACAAAALYRRAAVAGSRRLRRAARDLPRGRRARAAAAAGGLALPLGAAGGRAARRRWLERGAAARAGGMGGAQHAAGRRAVTSGSAGCRSSPTGSSRGRGTPRARAGCASTSPGCGWRCR